MENSILDKLEEERVVSFELRNGATELRVIEECDRWFDLTLNKYEAEQLLKELAAIVNAMK